MLGSRIKTFLLAAGLTIPCIAGAADGAYLEGNVTLAGTGAPAVQASVTLVMPEGTPGATATTVFTDEAGRYRIPLGKSAPPAGSLVSARMLGFRMAAPLPAGGVPVGNAAKGPALRLESVSNIAPLMPASAWMSKAPESDAKHLVNLQCSGCHQFPSEKVLRYAQQIEAVKGGPDGPAKAMEQWRAQVRKEGWRAAIKYMRAKTYDIFPEGSKVNIENIPWEAVQGEMFTLFNAKQAETMSEFLAQNFPTKTDAFQAADYGYGAPLGVTPRTVIREYQLPATSLVREAVSVPGSPYIWGADIQKNRVLRLDPVSGGQKWYPVPFEGATGPHTIVPAHDGTIWISMMDNDQLARLDPATEQWRLWTLRPTDLDEKKVFGGQATVHDISYDSSGHLATDSAGRIWITLIGLNMMGSLDPKSGRIEFHDTVPVEGLSPIAISLYSTTLSSDGTCAWFSQLLGSFGCFNTRTLEVESLVPFPEGAGPRRLAEDPNDTVWVPLYGSGQVMKYDGRARKVLATYDLPDRRAAPYAASWDERRKVLWISSTNADVVYRFDPAKETYKVYPLPRKQAYFRQLHVDETSGNLVGSYGNIPVGAGPSMAVVIEPGD